MATSSNIEGNLEEEIADIGAFTDNFRSELEGKFGLLYEHGQPRKNMDVSQKQKLMGLCKVLEGLKLSIDNFQTDSSKVCGLDSSEVTSAEMREIQGRRNVGRVNHLSTSVIQPIFRESGYTSSDMTSLPSTPGNSSNSLSRRTSYDTPSRSFNTAEMFDPSIPDSSSKEGNTQLKTPSFYLTTPSPSSTSISCDYDVSTDPTDGKAEQETLVKSFIAPPHALNDLSKPPSNEDNTTVDNESNQPSQ